MRFALIVTAVLLAVGGVAPVQAAGCNLGTANPWMASKGRPYMSEAYANGATCATAVVTIVVRAPDRKVLWVDAMPAEQLMTFVGAKTPPKMKAALRDWLYQSHTFKSTGDLPEWKKGADSPAPLGEFAFYPEEGIDQATYATIRAEKQAIFCYVQGMESLACVAIAKDGAATKVGLQTFPG